jgi:uncharacterized protein
MDPLEVIKKFYNPNSKAFIILVNHSKAVAEKAIKISEKFNLDKQFIYEAAILHDIGIFMTYTPKFDCYGNYPYIAHGYLGRELLQKEGLPKHALVCERHTGVGITKEEIVTKKLPLPPRDMIPISLEEKIIAYADKFFSKESDGSVKVNTVDSIIKELSRYGEEKVKTFAEWVEMFEGTAL